MARFPEIVWPCGLFSVKANAGYNGNWCLSHKIPNLYISDSNYILGKITCSFFLAGFLAYSKLPFT